MSRFAVLMVVFLGLPGAAGAKEPDQRLETESPAMVFSRVSGSVVLVRAETAQGLSQGSGVIVGKGQVVTNLHVIEGAKRVLVSVRGKEVEAKVTLTSKRDRDLALLAMDTTGGARATLRKSTDLVVGERVFAIGNPRGYEQTLTEGLVSALRKEGSAFVVQTSAALSPGSSGGGLFDSRGRLVGITTKQRTDGQALNFAHPVEWIQELLQGKSGAAGPSAAQYSVTARPQAVACQLRESARWGLFSEGLELLESTPGSGELALTGLDTTQPEFGTGSGRLVLTDLSRKAQVAVFTGKRKSDDVVFLSFEESVDIRAMLAHLDSEEGVPRLVTRSGLCEPGTREEFAERLGKAAPPAQTCESDADQCFLLAAQAEGGERFVYLKKACKLGHARACDAALVLAQDVGDSANVQLLERLRQAAGPTPATSKPESSAEPAKAPRTTDGKRKALRPPAED
ncbi:MAG: S1C family serine protease [Myxococcota bacterium]